MTLTATEAITIDTKFDDWVRSEKFHNSFLIPQDNILDAVVKHTAEEGLPHIAVTAAQGKFLNLIAKIIGAKRVLEVGTLGGYSAIWLARALPDDGHVTTLELSDHHAKVARENFKTAGLEKKITVIVGPAADSITQLHPEKFFDIAFIDADKQSNLLYFTEAKHLVRSGGIIMVDNVVRNGSVSLTDIPDERNEGVRKLLRVIKEDEEVEATTVSTVGEKGYDGYVFALRK